MNYKKDFENAIRMIDWQNDIIKQQADRIADLETTVAFKKTNPLSDKKIKDVFYQHCDTDRPQAKSFELTLDELIEFAKDIEKEHGIK